VSWILSDVVRSLRERILSASGKNPLAERVDHVRKPGALMRPFICVLVLLVTPSLRAAEPDEVFTQRILPIFQSPNPSSCIQCHLAAVDIKQYILPDHEKTFRSLRDQGLINLDAPDKSKILQLINMGANDNAGAALIHAKNRKLEYEAFAAWIRACANDPKLRNSPKLDPSELAKPSRPVEVIRHARKDRLLESFEQNVWAWRFRCMNCHTEGTPQNDKYRKEFGDRVAWVKKGGAEATMEFLIESKLIDAKNPEKSLMLRKPLNEVKHEGGTKFLHGDQAYKGFRTWIEDIAKIRGDVYTKASELPAVDESAARFGSDIWLKLTECSPDWDGKLLQANVHTWDAKKKAWSETPIATTDRAVAGKLKLWQHNLTLIAANDAQAKVWKAGKASLPAGKYLVRVFVDRKGRQFKDWNATLGQDEYVGEVEFQANWREGYGGMTSVSVGRIAK